MDFLRLPARPRRNGDPLIVTGAICLLTVFFVHALGTNELDDYLTPLPRTGQVVTVLVLLVLAVVLPVVAILVAAVSYSEAHLGLSRLVFMFGALILLFANCYFICTVVDDKGPVDCPVGLSMCPEVDDVPIVGVHPAWTYPAWTYERNARTMSWRTIGLAYLDCFHYSVVTGSTVGFGDMHASRWYTKLLTDVQILVSLGLTVLAVSRYFSWASGRR